LKATTRPSYDFAREGEGVSERVDDVEKVRGERREDLRVGRRRPCSRRCGSSERRGQDKEQKDMPDTRRELNAILEAIVVVVPVSWSWHRRQQIRRLN
jgi:hypothetical protein